ncbi:PREDICTED: uncharacterized protein LOC107347080 isoform X2 [Acropora digitifera]|uniref:uncharacterized protein LOC107347080 isoform X2 n=1 Tax=Acropora digitifera TaxID=70779 RepID=UPI00077A4097|nr:PREDICTED: uncharacterized protein LOC107347080 isoform X2 [Acropora digitifera]
MSKCSSSRWSVVGVMGLNNKLEVCPYFGYANIFDSRLAHSEGEHSVPDDESNATATNSNPVQGEDSELNVTATDSNPVQDRQRKAGVPSDDDLLNLSAEPGAKWTMLSSALGTPKTRIEAIDDENKRMVDKSYDFLLSWKQRNGCEATYQVLEAGLCHNTVEGRKLAEKYCYERIVS